jgi:hypothetical protein
VSKVDDLRSAAFAMRVYHTCGDVVWHRWITKRPWRLGAVERGEALIDAALVRNLQIWRTMRNQVLESVFAAQCEIAGRLLAKARRPR